MSTKASPTSSANDDDEPTRPIPLQLIARLAAQDPAVQLKIGVTDSKTDAPTAEEHEEKNTK